MTDRYNSLIVILDKDIRDDDAQYIIDAIKQFRAVVTVKGHVANIEDAVAYEKAKHEIWDKLIDVMRENEKE